MLPVPMTRAWSGHSKRSFVILTLSRSTSPHTTSRANRAEVSTVVGSGADVILTSGGAVAAGTSTHHVYSSWVRSTFPAASTARTENVCVPMSSERAAGEVHGAHASKSTLHWNVTGPALSLPSKRKRWTAVVLASAGDSSSCVIGAMMSLFGTSSPEHTIV